MKKPALKKQHPAEIAAEEQMIVAIRSAAYFMASLFKGAGEYEKLNAATVLGAVAAGELLASRARGTQRAMIYAIGVDNRATLITYALIDRLIAQAKAEDQIRKGKL